MSVCGHPEPRLARFVDSRRKLLVGEHPLARIRVRQTRALRGHNLDHVHASLSLRPNHAPDILGALDSRHEICELWKIHEELVSRVWPHVISGSDEVRHVHNTSVIQLAHSYVSEMI